MVISHDQLTCRNLGARNAMDAMLRGSGFKSARELEMFVSDRNR